MHSTTPAAGIRPLSDYVLDASALIALVNQERGGEKVRPLMPDGVISAVNFCETLQVLRRGGMPVESVTLALTPLVSQPIPFDASLAYVAASIHERTRDHGLSFGDCACLALAMSRKVAAVTAEKEWKNVDIGIEIITIR
jgi:ribonuclease VapC